MPLSIHPVKPAWSVWAVAALAIAAIGWVDYFTGAEVRVFPLYFAPISFVAWYRSRSNALVAAGSCALVWEGSNFLAGLRFSQPGIWFLNTLVQGSSFAIVGLLVGALRAALERERGLSRIDPLTSLSNRRAFYEDANRILALCRRARRPITVAYIDVDNFKTVNDTRGHEAGDDLLRHVAEQLRATLRASDLSARLGGDEFAILLPEVGPDEAAVTLERLRSLKATVPSGQSPATLSIGAVTFITIPENVAQMVQRADSRMYEAKTAGKDRVRLEVAGNGGR